MLDFSRFSATTRLVGVFDTVSGKYAVLSAAERGHLQLRKTVELTGGKNMYMNGITWIELILLIAQIVIFVVKL